jgi:hypothetical protein
MAAMELFNIKLDKPHKSAWDVRPQDQLGEFSPFEMGLKLFCFEQNHEVLIEIGNEKRYVYLHPDISSEIDILPDDISQLSRGEPVEIVFAEIGMSVDFVPIDEKVICKLCRFGYSLDVKSFECDLTQVVEALCQFLNELIQLAVSGGYISQEDAELFLNQK